MAVHRRVGDQSGLVELARRKVHDGSMHAILHVEPPHRARGVAPDQPLEEADAEPLPSASPLSTVGGNWQ